MKFIGLVNCRPLKENSFIFVKYSYLNVTSACVFVKYASNAVINIEHCMVLKWCIELFNVLFETHCRRHARSGVFCGQLQTVTEDILVHFYFCSTSVFSVLEICYENELYKFTWHWQSSGCQ